MPQELQVLQCYSCKTFQVDIVKKKAKWACKMCGEKQSIKKIFYRGSGKECRLFVQELAEKRIKSENESHIRPENNTFAVTETESEDECVDKAKSKWFEFMENSEKVENTNFEDDGNPSGGTKRKLDSGESRRGKENVSKWYQYSTIISSENNVEEVDHRREVGKLNNKSGKEADGESKWDEFTKNRICFANKDENLTNELNNVNNKRYKMDKPADLDHKSRNKLNQTNIFESDTNKNIDSYLEI